MAGAVLDGIDAAGRLANAIGRRAELEGERCASLGTALFPFGCAVRDWPGGTGRMWALSGYSINSHGRIMFAKRLEDGRLPTAGAARLAAYRRFVHILLCSTPAHRGASEPAPGRICTLRPKYCHYAIHDIDCLHTTPERRKQRKSISNTLPHARTAITTPTTPTSPPTACPRPAALLLVGLAEVLLCELVLLLRLVVVVTVFVFGAVVGAPPRVTPPADWVLMLELELEVAPPAEEEEETEAQSCAHSALVTPAEVRVQERQSAERRADAWQTQVTSVEEQAWVPVC
ncbi:hypothetical protein CALVIDRAFT_91625 [Calocera viscosa TUFC12733]|uniref:Uncharacterized protein n=1 Tax=Calocera viscosa (strain TUFC12733) TaxID=1330018 RepID=A0A167MTS5_CALVF|nr:hypothetical protein CALVIDRAFT_91625 [Calocera viscosa TUFC12733]